MSKSKIDYFLVKISNMKYPEKFIVMETTRKEMRKLWENATIFHTDTHAFIVDVFHEILYIWKIPEDGIVI